MIYMKTFLLAMLSVTVLICVLTPIIYIDAANTSPSSGGDKLKNPLEKQGINSIEDLIPKVLAIVVQVGIVICTFFIIYAGFMYVTAAGDEGKIKTAHSIFLWCVVGTMVLLGAQIISSVLGNTVKSVLGK